MTLLNITTFIGKFHPLLVHLPIGFLILAALLQWVGSFKKYASLRAAVPASLLAGCMAALFSCITGYLLSVEGGYNTTTLNLHMWMGILTTLLALFAWLISIRVIPGAIFKRTGLLDVGLALMLVVISITGHWGGTLTHGEGYLSFNSNTGTINSRPPITDISQAFIFGDIVAPILQHKCADCHNSSKMKGELSLQNLAQIEKGGKHGAVVVNGKPAESELIKRVLLDPSDKKFMPTDGKPSLSRDEIKIISWWVARALGKEDQTVAAVTPPEEVLQAIKNYFGANIQTADNNNLTKPNTNLQLTAPALKPNSIKDLEQAGFAIKQIHFNPDLLDITLPADTTDKKEKLSLLQGVKDNIIWLNIAGNQVTDENISVLAGCSNLQRLRLDNNPISDEGLKQLGILQQLQSINLCNTRITPAAIDILTALPALQKAYIWGTALPQKDTLLRKDSSLHIIAGSNNVH